MRPKKILFIFGTRPESIKLAPLIIEAGKKKYFKAKVCITSQHKKILKDVLDLFNIKVDFKLNILRQGSRLDELNAKILLSLEKVLAEEKPHLVVVQGDTTSAFCGALSAFYKKIPIAHVEAGLRSFDKYQPFPEEINRKLISSLSDYHFCPTNIAKNNLLKENIAKKDIFVVGNTVLDALRIASYWVKKFSDPEIEKFSGRIVLITLHRRENWGNLENIFSVLKRAAIFFKNDVFIYPVHPNPLVQKQAKRAFKNIPNFKLLPPLIYKDLVYLLNKCYLVVTDSGGLQEEAPFLNKPVFVVRNATERPEVIKNGSAKLIGTDSYNIFNAIKMILENKAAYKKMQNKKSPYGDGFAAKRIIKIMKMLI